MIPAKIPTEMASLEPARRSVVWKDWMVEMVWFELAAPTQSYRTASLPPAWIAVISLWLRAACGRYLGPNVHRARRHEEDAAPSRHRSLSPNESAGRPSVMNSTATTAPSSQAASREPRI